MTVSLTLPLKEASKFHTPPVLLLNAVAMVEANVVALKEFPVASVIVLLFPLIVPTVLVVRMLAA